MKKIPLSACVIATLMAFSAPAHSTDDPFEVTDGVYVGHVIGSPGDHVVVELRGTSLVILDPKGVAILSYDRWVVAGPGGKAGDIQLKADGQALGMGSRAGKMRKAPPSPATALRLRMWPERDKAVLCATDPHAEGAKITRVPASGASGGVAKGVVCYDLAQVWSPTAPATGDKRPLPEPDLECMRECRQQNMMRAVAAEVIDADCRAACTKR